MSRKFNYETKFDSVVVEQFVRHFPENQSLIDFIEAVRAEASIDLVLRHVQKSWGDGPYLFLLGYLGDTGTGRDGNGRFIEK